jgi:AcrR family transcriptional regulator
MGSSTRRRRLPKAERRRIIEEAASALFAERGYAAAKLDDIARAAGVTKQLLYRHFGSKKELYLALLAKHRDGLLGGIAEGMSRPGSLTERIPRVADEWFAYVEENPYASAMLFRDSIDDPDIEAFYRENHAAARALGVALMRGEAELEIPEEHQEPLAEFIRSAVAGLALWWAEHPEVARSTVVEAAVGAVTNGLGLRPKT